MLLSAGDGIFIIMNYYLLFLFEEDLLQSLPLLVFPSVDVMLFLTVVFILHHLFASSVLVRLLLLPEAQSKTKPASLTEDIPLHRDKQSAPLYSLKRLPPAGVFLVDEARVFITERSALQTVSPQSGLPPPGQVACHAISVFIKEGSKKGSGRVPSAHLLSLNGGKAHK